MTRYFTSDTHFNHSRIVELAHRPFASIEDMNNIIVNTFNKVVKSTDELYLLGDVALGPWPEGLNCAARINCKKFLVPGNHDRISSLNKQPYIDRFMSEYEAIFEVLPESFIMKVGGVECMLSHYPYTGDHTAEDRFTEIRPVDNGLPLIHGHTHLPHVVTYSDRGTMQIHVGVDAWGYKPVNENKIKELLNDRPS